jgi:pullulanase/glycogen debranching enzyme
VLALLGACGGAGGSDAAGNSRSDASSITQPPPAASVRIHYQRADAAYAGWGVYSWQGPITLSGAWPATDQYRFDQSDSFGTYVDIAVDATQGAMKFLINKGTGGGDAEKAPNCDLGFDFASTIATQGQEVWVKWDQCQVFSSLAAAQAISIGHARALWLQKDTITWPSAPASAHYRIYHAANGGIAVDGAGVSGADGYFELAVGGALPDSLKTRYPQQAGATVLAVPADAQAQAASLLRGQLVVVQLDGDTPQAATQLQVQGVLDDLYATAAQPQTLGPSFAGDGTPTLRLWAPTAQEVTLNVGSQSIAMTRDDASGVWSASGDKAWTNSATYTYSVKAWSWRDNRVETNIVTDPYATSLNADAWGAAPQQALLADLDSAALKPANWDADSAPALAVPQSTVLYELQVRDFSATDASVPAADRGKYLAFTHAGSNGMQHLAAMAAAGVTHVHLLPAFDFGSVNEAGCTDPSVAPDAPTSQNQQAAVMATKDADCYNWGYDPKHYGAPDGSFSSDAADGSKRVIEFREMVHALHTAGLRVVMDVVYNHTAGNFLDQIVPGYYYRLDADGNIENASCCEDTAPEFAMMEKLMADTLVRWAKAYDVDGFRFDIMGFLPLPALQRAQAAVNAAVGSSRPTYFYGEAWNFGPAANDALFQQARQANLAGTGIGSFNDRIRDAVRGGGPFDGGDSLIANQGFGNGECVDLNASATCTETDLQARQNWIRLSMAGNLADFTLNGVKGSAIDYGGQPAGYTRNPQEDVNYVSVHDGQTLYDINQYKLPAATTPAQRARAQVVALAPVLLGQGVPFLHAGDELLRSKSLDANSYNSGDWFNRIDWTASGNGIDLMGLPPAPDNQGNWPQITSVLSNPNVVPSSADIVATREAVKDLLRVRRSSKMFRLATGAEVMRCVSFPDAASQVDGLIVMQIGLGDATCGDGAYKRVVVLINAAPATRSYAMAALAGHALQLHPVQANGSDAVVKSAVFDAATGGFAVPGRTAAVFVER